MHIVNNLSEFLYYFYHINTLGDALYIQLTVVFIIPVPWVRMELAIWRMLMEEKNLAFEERSTNIWLLRL